MLAIQRCALFDSSSARVALHRFGAWLVAWGLQANPAFYNVSQKVGCLYNLSAHMLLVPNLPPYCTIILGIVQNINFSMFGINKFFKNL